MQKQTKQNGTNTKKPSVSKQLMGLKQAKWYTGIVASAAISSTTTFLDLVTPGIGTGQNQRVGTSIQLDSVHFRGQFIIGDTTNVIRVLVFRWLVDNNSDVPSASELFDSTSDVFSGTILLNPKRFKVLHDEVISMDTYHPTKVWNLKLKLNSRATFSSGTSGVGHIYTALLSDSGGIPHPSVSYDYQLLWKDVN